MANLSLPLRSSRLFGVSSYQFSHGLLLFRSVRTNEVATRLDILFQNVVAMELRTWTVGIQIDEIVIEKLGHRLSVPQELMVAGLKAYSLTGEGWQGFILASQVHLHEDDSFDRFGRSYLMGPETER